LIALAVLSLLLQPRPSLALPQGILVADAWPQLLALVRQPPIEPIEFVIGQTFQRIRNLFGLFWQQRRDDPYVVTRQRMPPTEIVRLLDMVVVNVLACNTDAHAKNYSIMIRASATSLAPMYDVMCCEVWERR
jgi:HipA-like C-terminal domain